MIVAAGRRYLPSLDVLKVGLLYSMDSGMGGSFDILYKGVKDGKHHFVRPAKTDWPRRDFDIEAERVTSVVYICSPIESWAEIQWDEECARSPHYVKMFKAHEAWYPPEADGQSRRNLIAKGLLTV